MKFINLQNIGEGWVDILKPILSSEKFLEFQELLNISMFPSFIGSSGLNKNLSDIEVVVLNFRSPNTENLKYQNLIRSVINLRENEFQTGFSKFNYEDNPKFAYFSPVLLPNHDKLNKFWLDILGEIISRLSSTKSLIFIYVGDISNQKILSSVFNRFNCNNYLNLNIFQDIPTNPNWNYVISLGHLTVSCNKNLFTRNGLIDTLLLKRKKQKIKW